MNTAKKSLLILVVVLGFGGIGVTIASFFLTTGEHLVETPVNVMEIDAMMRTAEVVLLGAINRRESRGAHSRLDFPNRDDVNFLKHTLAYYSTDGEPKMTWHPVIITRYAPVERKY